LGQDISVQKDFIECHVEFMESQGIAASLGEILFPEEYKAQSNFLAWIEGTPYQFDFLTVKSMGATWRNFYTSNIAVSSGAIQNLFFDADFKYLFEDLDFGYRLFKKTGIQPVFNPKAVALHLHWRTIDEFIERQQQAGREAYWFANKHKELSGPENDFCVIEILRSTEYRYSDFQDALEEIKICHQSGASPQNKAYETVLRFCYAKGVQDAYKES
jgi:GT2 family glycosyltransferase